MKKTVSLSVAMTTCNGARYLPAQLESILAQTRQPDEMIVCDDCSDDGTAIILREFQSKAPFSVVIHSNEKRLGLNKNFERAIGYCTSDIVALADQDDVFRPQKFDRLVTYLEEHPEAAAVFSDARIVDADLVPKGLTLFEFLEVSPEKKERVKNRDLFELLLERNLVAGMTLAFRAHYREIVLPIPTYLYWNHDWWIAILISATRRLHFIDELLVDYRRHDASFTMADAPKTKRTQQEHARYKIKRDSDCVAQYFLARKRLVETHAQSLESMGDWQRVHGKMQHLASRNRIRSCPSRVRRLPLAAREALSLHYFRYSQRPLAKLFKDLLGAGWAAHGDRANFN